MKPEEMLSILHTVEKLKDTTRHSYTSGGRHESVAEHCWRLVFMAYLMKDEYPELDTDKVMKMCLIHDLGELFTGDIPSFLKSSGDETKEENLLESWVKTLPEPLSEEMALLYEEMNALSTPEAKLYKCLDQMEAVIQHNEAPLSTWLPLEYDLNRTYAIERCAFSPATKALREAILQETEQKLRGKTPEHNE